MYLSKERFIAALKRIRAQIAAGLQLSYYDDDTPGDKSTHCSWGFCSENKEQWPDADDHLWPDQFKKHDRIAPLYRSKGQHCPLDRDQDLKTTPTGCFYRCRVFNPNKHGGIPRREDALELYDITVRLHEPVESIG